MTTPAHLTLDIEACVISALFHDPKFAIPEVAAVGLGTAHFTDPRHKLIYSAIRRLALEGSKPDPYTVEHYLTAHGKFTEAGAKDHLIALLDAAPHAHNVRAHALLLVRDRAGTTVTEGAQDAQVGEALTYLDQPATAFLSWEYAPLDAMLGPIPPGTINFLCAASGQGKTAFLLSLMNRWHLAGRRIYYAGLESKPLILRTQWACRTLGIDPGDILSGRYHARHDAATVREQIRAAILAQRDNPIYRAVRFDPHPEMNVPAMVEALTEAAEWKADLVVIDHIDHIGGGDTTNLYAESRGVHRVLKALVEKYALRTLIASQLNNTGLASDPLLNHRPVRDERVFMGGHKKQIADLMLGFYRPLKPDLGKSEHARFRNDKITKDEMVEPGVNVMQVMKHRLDGRREGQRARLGFAKGEILDSPADVPQRTNFVTDELPYTD
jgi:replicative DNA helicase